MKALTLNIKTHGTLMVQGASKLITPSSWGISGTKGGMEDLELVEELLLNNHLFMILWQKLKIKQSQPNHLYPQIPGSNLRSETGWTHKTKTSSVLTTHLSQLLRPLASTPWCLTPAKRQHGLGHLKTYRVVQWYIFGFTCLNSTHLQ